MVKRIYRFENREERDQYSFAEDTKGMPYHADVQHLFRSLNSLIRGEQQGLLDKNGYVAALDGPYGAGKTTAARTLMHELIKSEDADKISEIYHTFLPFNNPNEAIAVFLNKLAERLWREHFADIRSDIQQFILEVSPESRYEASVSLGGFSVSWPITSRASSYDGVRGSITNKLARAVEANKTIVIILDDLDRLEPYQIVAIMRMVEKLRELPRVIIILPIYKQIIKNAFTGQLGIDASIGSALLRKLIDFEIKISNRQSDLERVFKKELHKYSSGTGDLTSGQLDLCWSILLHNVVIAEAYDLISREKSGGQEKWVILKRSPYLTYIRDIFKDHISDYRSRVEPYPAHYLNANNDPVWAQLGLHYKAFVGMNNNGDGPTQLAEMRNVDNVMKLITTDEHVVADLKAGSGWPAFNKKREEKSSEPALTNFFLPILKAQKADETLLTDTYKLRDMSILARSIGGSRKLPTALKDTGKLYQLIKDEFDNFR